MIYSHHNWLSPLELNVGRLAHILTGVNPCKTGKAWHTLYVGINCHTEYTGTWNLHHSKDTAQVKEETLRIPNCRYQELQITSKINYFKIYETHTIFTSFTIWKIWMDKRGCIQACCPLHKAPKRSSIIKVVWYLLPSVMLSLYNRNLLARQSSVSCFVEGLVFPLTPMKQPQRRQKPFSSMSPCIKALNETLQKSNYRKRQELAGAEGAILPGKQNPKETQTLCTKLNPRLEQARGTKSQDRTSRSITLNIYRLSLGPMWARGEHLLLGGWFLQIYLITEARERSYT